jgi:hypothetical protein
MQEGVVTMEQKRARILVVEDEPKLAAIIGRTLAVDHEVIVLTSAREALEKPFPTRSPSRFRAGASLAVRLRGRHRDPSLVHEARNKGALVADYPTGCRSTRGAATLVRMTSPLRRLHARDRGRRRRGGGRRLAPAVEPLPVSSDVVAR